MIHITEEYDIQEAAITRLQALLLMTVFKVDLRRHRSGKYKLIVRAEADHG